MTYEVKINKLRLPTDAPDDYSEGAFCIHLSPEWYFIVQGAMELLEIRAAWEWTTWQEWQQIRQWLARLAALPRVCDDCPDTEPCPECPPLPTAKPPSGSAATPAVGRLGMTLEELEDFVMSWNLRGQLAWVDGKLCYWNDGCCEWKPVDILSGSSPFASPISAGELGLSGWTAAGKPPLPTIPAIDHNNPDYITGDSQACAKATAIVNQVYSVLDGLEDVVDLFDVGAPAVAEVTGVLALLIGTGTILPATLLVIAGVVYTAVSEFTVDGVRDDLDNILADAATKDAFICALVPQLEQDTELEAGELATALDFMFDDFGAPPLATTTAIKSIMNAFPMAYWQNKIAEAIPDTECACEDFLPFGYVPPANQAAVYNYLQNSYINGAGSTNVHAVLTGSAGNTLQDVLQLQQIGSWDGDEVVSAYAGLFSGQYYTGFGVLFQLPTPCEIDALRFDMTWLGGSQASGGSRSRLYGYDPDLAEWTLLATNASTGHNVNQPPYIEFTASYAGLISHLYAQIGNLVNQAEGLRHFRALPKLTGVRDSIPFLETLEGQAP